jgi:hypothetical protein
MNCLRAKVVGGLLRLQLYRRKNWRARSLAILSGCSHNRSPTAPERGVFDGTHCRLGFPYRRGHVVYARPPHSVEPLPDAAPSSVAEHMGKGQAEVRLKRAGRVNARADGRYPDMR